MDPKLLMLAVFLSSSFCELLVNAASPEELALRNAILSAGAGNVILTKDVILTAHLPQLPDRKSLTVRGRCGSSGKLQCVISGAKKYRHFWKSNIAPATLVLDNLVITSTMAVNETAAVDFGADRSLLTVSNVKFVDNPRALSLNKMKGVVRNSQFVGHTQGAVLHKADEVGPGETGNWELKFVSCLFSGNQQRRGGAAIRVLSALVTIDKCTFQKNSAVSAFSSGGALRFVDSEGKISGSTFVGNTASGNGGAISMLRSNVKVATSSFQENVATEGGGALDGETGGDGYVASFDRCSFAKNKALNGFGGVLVVDEGRTTFCKCTFSGNTGKSGTASNVYATCNTGVASPCSGIEIFTNPEIVIPYVTEGPGASITFKKGRC